MRERKDALLVGEMIYFTNSLACVLGDANQAAMLQQVFWWMYQAAKDKTGRIGKFEDGRWWTYQEMSDWRERFSWMSRKTLQRTRKKLEDKGVLLRKDEANPQAPGGVRVWLSVDENRLEQLQDEYLAALENEDDGSSPNVGQVPQGDYPNVGQDLSQHGTSFTNIHKQTDSNIHNGSAAPAADAALAAAPNDAAPLEQKQTPSGQQSYIQSVQGKGPRDRTKEKAEHAADDEGGKGRVNPAELTELGKLIVHLSGKGSRNKVPTKSLTERQARMLDTEVEFFHGDEKITITPNELYDREPKLVRHWLEKIVHPKLYARFAQKRGYTLGREMLIKTLTLEGDQGYEIRDYYRWRESQKHLERLNADSYVPQPDEEAVPQFVDDGPAPAFGPITQEEIDAMFADDEDETEGSADNDEQE